VPQQFPFLIHTRNYTAKVRVKVCKRRLKFTPRLVLGDD
jgi:hypothetical protein